MSKKEKKDVKKVVDVKINDEMVVNEDSEVIVNDKMTDNVDESVEDTIEKEAIRLLQNLNPQITVDQVKLFVQNPSVVKQKKKVEKPSRLYEKTDKQLPASSKLPKQAEIALNSLTGQMTLKEWTDAAIKGGLVTTQEPIRIIMYYRPRLIDLGLIKEVA